jgi:hypothetical protein
VFRVYFSPSHYEAFVSTEDAAFGLALPDVQRDRWENEYRILNQNFWGTD